MPDLALTRSLRTSMDPVVRAVLSRGAGYEPQPPGAFFDGHSVRGYFVDLRAKTIAAGTPEELPPAALAQLALGWWDRALSGDQGAWASFGRISALLEARAEHGEDGVRWPYGMPVPKYGLAPPWYSAMAQGQAASVFVRAYVSTHERRYRRLALEAVRPLLSERDTDLVSLRPNGPILEEAPSRPASHILNGWIYALWGLWDVSSALADRKAAAQFDASAACLAEMLHRYDVGWWTRYSLYPHRLADLAKPFYHALHVTQSAVMHRLTGRAEFADAARRWHRYDGEARRALALIQKAAFVAVARGRR
jgi:heparosan-N-sulfate-glucuronate 5-epimerase